ncbi:RNA polymerase sigma factor [Dethiobacter alkaliphilus]|uniref:RNA polymerase sigma factor n=1 Tax=Dethiobacter alkaliphilus TaxID=427926 RepID=UPI00222775DA|nr:sigma-70 family RNA polymerase sigma factor [Dethiobacter alkaliphilus]MCW3489813.1 sigma-70 family RNA polymerase sigma factor [Dethiobacter alkaliphilus]
MDQELKQLFMAGDKKSFQELYNLLIDSTLRTAVVITKNQEIAKDAVQETFIRIYKNRHSFDVNKAFQPWFYRILTNECNRLMKKESKILNLNKPMDDEEYKLAAKTEEDYSDLYEAIQSLKDLYRIPIILKYLQGLSEKEIAETLVLNQNTVKTRLYKGRDLLKSRLKEDCEGGSRCGY